MCRASWKNDPLLNHLDLKSDLDPEAVQTYLDWIYTSTLSIPSQIAYNNGTFSLVMLKLWTMANAVEDPSFKAKVIITYFAEAPLSWTALDDVMEYILEWASVERKCDDEIREFIIDSRREWVKPSFFKKARREDLETLKKRWMKRLNIEMDLVSDDKVTSFSVGVQGVVIAGTSLFFPSYM